MTVSVTLVILFIGVGIIAATIMGIAATSKRFRKSRLLHCQRFESRQSRIPIDVEMDAPDLQETTTQTNGYFDIPARAATADHPPVYVVEDLEHPPPIYEAVYSVPERPTVQELKRLRTCLEILKRQHPTVDTTSYDVVIRQASISSLQSWILKLETLRQSLPRETSIARSTIRMFRSASSDGESPTEEVSPMPVRRSAGIHRPGLRQRETGWAGVGQPREVRPLLDPVENTLSLYVPDEESEEEGRFDMLRRQAIERRMRAMEI